MLATVTTAVVRGIEAMQQRRNKQKPHELCSGPGKLGRALGITGEHHGTIMAGRGKSAACGLVTVAETPRVVTDIRVGISQAVDYPWRFLAADHPHVSVPRGKVKLPS
jgi:DNA-3-methyladenine glycosylase